MSDRDFWEEDLDEITKAASDGEISDVPRNNLLERDLNETLEAANDSASAEDTITANRRVFEEEIKAANNAASEEEIIAANNEVSEEEIIAANDTVSIDGIIAKEEEYFEELTEEAESEETDEYWHQREHFKEESAEERKNERYVYAGIKRRKKKNIVGKVLALTGGALLFGLVAGATMVGVYKYARESGFLPKTNTTILGRSLEQPVLTETEAVDTTKSDSAVKNILDVSQMVQSAMSSVVAINGKEEMTYESWFGGKQTYTTPTSGSGIIIGENDEELLIVTNNHVVDEASDLSVVFIDESEVKATVKGGDSDSDLAVIAVKFADLSEETKSSITVASIGNSDSIKVGEGVVAIGNALGYGQSVTQGIVSAKNREVETKNGRTQGLIQTDAAINPGNSGGALLNLNGEVIGINSVKYSSTEVEGMGYAIPITTVEGIIKDLATKTTRTLVDEEKQGVIGIQGQDIDQTMSETYDIPQGVYVYRILENGAAASSDLQEKDIIIKLEGDKIRSMEDLKKTLSYFQAGDKVKLTIYRLNRSEYEEMTVDVVLGKKRDVSQ